MNPLKTAYCRTYQTVFRAALPLLPYREPHQPQSVEQIVPLLKQEGLNRPLIVTDANLSKLDLVQPLIDALTEAGLSYTLFDETVANPTIANVEVARETYLANCCVVKPSAYSPHTSAIIARIVNEVFERGHVDCILGGRQQNAQLLDQRFDYIFFTGSVNVGRLVQEKAAKYLTPVTLPNPVHSLW